MPIQLTRTCLWCEQPVTYGSDATGRPARYCSTACRSAAHRHRKRTMPGRNERRCADCYLVHAGECI